VVFRYARRATSGSGAVTPGGRPCGSHPTTGARQCSPPPFALFPSNFHRPPTHLSTVGFVRAPRRNTVLANPCLSRSACSLCLPSSPQPLSAGLCLLHSVSRTSGHFVPPDRRPIATPAVALLHTLHSTPSPRSTLRCTFCLNTLSSRNSVFGLSCLSCCTDRSACSVSTAAIITPVTRWHTPPTAYASLHAHEPLPHFACIVVCFCCLTLNLLRTLYSAVLSALLCCHLQRLHLLARLLVPLLNSRRIVCSLHVCLKLLACHLPAASACTVSLADHSAHSQPLYSATTPPSPFLVANIDFRSLYYA
jgi:hypothetical protein